MGGIKIDRAVELIRQEIAEIDKRHEVLQNELQQWIMTANKTQGHIQENRHQHDQLEGLLTTILNPPTKDEDRHEKEVHDFSEFVHNGTKPDESGKSQLP